jgi:hypothetical protein
MKLDGMADNEQENLPGMALPRVPMGERFTVMGKEVLYRGVHYADVFSPEAAQIVANTMNEFEARPFTHAAGDVRPSA